MDKYIKRINALLRTDSAELARTVQRVRNLINGEEAIMARDNMKHMHYLHRITASDQEVLREKEATYQGSWKKRGGRGAWLVGATRMWDRLEHMVHGLHDDDVFAAIEADPLGDDGTPLAALRDLRRYLLLVEAEMCARGVVYPEGEPTEQFPTSYGKVPQPVTTNHMGGSIECPDCNGAVWMATLATEGTRCPHCDTDLAAPAIGVAPPDTALDGLMGKLAAATRCTPLALTAGLGEECFTMTMPEAEQVLAFLTALREYVAPSPGHALSPGRAAYSKRLHRAVRSIAQGLAATGRPDGGGPARSTPASKGILMRERGPHEQHHQHPPKATRRAEDITPTRRYTPGDTRPAAERDVAWKPGQEWKPEKEG